MGEKAKLDHLPFTAYHEAGHAFALCLLNIPFSNTTINSSDEYLGYTKWIPEDNPGRQELLDRMVVAAAGIVATSFHPDGHYHALALGGVDNDIERIREIARQLASNEDEYFKLIDDNDRRTRELLGNNRASVKRIAEALLEKRTLSYAAVQQIINKD